MDNPRQCFAHFHMTIEEFGLWNHARSLSHESGKFYLSGPKVALDFAGTNKNTVYRIGTKLIDKGWFRVIRARFRDPDTGVWRPPIVYPLSHQEWIAENTESQCNPCPKSVMDGIDSIPVSSTSIPVLRSSIPVSSTSIPVLRSSIPVSSTSIPENGNKSDIEFEIKSERESERTSKPKTRAPLPHSTTDTDKINGQVKELRTWMLGLDPPLKFMPASKDKETESTKAIIVRRLQEGVSVKDIKQAIGNIIPLDNDPNPSFAVRDNLDSGIDRIQADREEAQRTAEKIAYAIKQEKQKAAAEAAHRARQDAENESLIEDELPSDPLAMAVEL